MAVPAVRTYDMPALRQEATVADKAARPEDPGNKVSSGKKLGSPEQAPTASRAKPGNSAGQQDEAISADEVRPKFREALERKRAREAGTIGAPPGKDAGKIHGAHGPAGNRRSFRRKSG
jgi:uncharacterized protein DUF5302